MKPRVLFVSRERHRLPLDDVQRRKWNAVSAEMDFRVVAAAAVRSPARDDRFRLLPPLRPRLFDGIGFYGSLPFRVAQELRVFDPTVVVVQGVHEAALVLLARKLAHSEAKVVLDVQGDWRTVTKLYGSRLRRLLSPFADAFGPLAVRRADAIRTASHAMTRLVRDAGGEPSAVFPSYVDASAFTSAPPKPLPGRPRAVSVAVLERYKALDTLVAAWRLAALRVPDAELRLVGTGTLQPLVEELVREFPNRVTWTPRLTAREVAEAMDEATVVLLPSRSEGLPRVAIEALARGRPVIGGRGGGTPDIIEDGVNGLLVDPDDPADVAHAIVRVLGEPDLAEGLARGARETAPRWLVTPEEYAAKLGALVRGA